MPCLVVGLISLGLYWGLTPKLNHLWFLWMTDPLRQIGIIMPLAALYFFFKAAPDIDWTQGRWWGSALMALPIVWSLTWGADASLSGPIAGRPTGIGLAPTGLLLAFCFSGAAVFFGGVAAWRTLRFPLFLLLWVNPIPSVLTAFDLQLQTIAALTARGFAHLIGLPVEPGLLRMMFSPSLGMFIAPECNGLRSMAAMLCLSLIWGHVHGMSRLAHGLYVLTAVTMAYLMNLVRLCLVVVYYGFAVRFESIASMGEEIDYVIGGFVFFGLALFVFGVPKRFKSA